MANSCIRLPVIRGVATGGSSDAQFCRLLTRGCVNGANEGNEYFLFGNAAGPLMCSTRYKHWFAWLGFDLPPSWLLLGGLPRFAVASREFFCPTLSSPVDGSLWNLAFRYDVLEEDIGAT